MRLVASSALAVILLLSLSLMAGDQRPAAGSDDRGSQGGGGGSSSMGSRGVAASPSTTPTIAPAVTNRDVYSNTSAHVSSLHSSMPMVQTPNLARTSFVSPNLWLRSEEYFFYLRTYYGVSPYYFRRFYLNSEPLVTPQLAKLTLRKPVFWSTSMVTALDQLETMVRDRQEGKSVSQQEIAAKTEEIRDLAKQIRSDQSVAFYDLRKEKDLLKGMNLGTLEALTQLREMITSLDAQLRGLYDEPKSFAVSVGSLSQPSFQSLAKGIEKLTKSIETSSRKI